jgi:hypothetical protein
MAVTSPALSESYYPADESEGVLAGLSGFEPNEVAKPA